MAGSAVGLAPGRKLRLSLHAVLCLRVATILASALPSGAAGKIDARPGTIAYLLGQRVGSEVALDAMMLQQVGDGWLIVCEPMDPKQKALVLADISAKPPCSVEVRGTLAYSEESGMYIDQARVWGYADSNGKLYPFFPKSSKGYTEWENMVELTGEQPDTGEEPREGVIAMSGGPGYPDVVPSEAVELAGLVVADAGYDGLVTGVKDFGTFIYVKPTNIDYWPDHLYLKVNVPEQLQDATRLTTRNDSVLITGVWAVWDGEVQVDAGNLTVAIGQEVALWPLGMPNRSVGGAAFVAESGPLANTGVEHAYGAYNLGAWVSVCGRVTAVDDTPGHDFPEFFYLDDGSLLLDTTGYTGLRINLKGQLNRALPAPEVGQYVIAEGFASAFTHAGTVRPCVNVRADFGRQKRVIENGTAGPSAPSVTGVAYRTYSEGDESTPEVWYCFGPLGTLTTVVRAAVDSNPVQKSYYETEDNVTSGYSGLAFSPPESDYLWIGTWGDGAYAGLIEQGDTTCPYYEEYEELRPWKRNPDLYAPPMYALLYGAGIRQRQEPAWPPIPAVGDPDISFEPLGTGFCFVCSGMGALGADRTKVHWINLAGHGYQADLAPFPIQLAYEVTGCATMQSTRFGAARMYLWLGELLPAANGRRRTRMHLFEMDGQRDVGFFSAPGNLYHLGAVHAGQWPATLDVSYNEVQDTIWAGGQAYAIPPAPAMAVGEAYEFTCGGYGWRLAANQGD